MGKTLNERILEAIIRNESEEWKNWPELAANECEAIAMEFAKGFMEWVNTQGYYLTVNDRWHIQYDEHEIEFKELITLYKDSLK